MRLRVPAIKAPNSGFIWSSPPPGCSLTSRCSNPHPNSSSVYYSILMLQCRYFGSESYIRKLRLKEYQRATNDGSQALPSEGLGLEQPRYLFAKLESIRNPSQNEVQNAIDDHRFEVLRQLTDSVLKVIEKLEAEARGLSESDRLPTIEQTYGALEARKYRRELLHRIAKRTSLGRVQFYRERRREELAGFLLPPFNTNIDNHLKKNSQIADETPAFVECLRHLIAMSIGNVVEDNKDTQQVSQMLFRRKSQTWDDLPPFPRRLTPDTFVEYLRKLAEREYLKYGIGHRNGTITDIIVQLFSLRNVSTRDLRTVHAYNLAISFAVDTSNLRLARNLFKNMSLDNVKPDVDTLNLLMSAGFRPRVQGLPINRQFEYLLRTLVKMRQFGIQANRTSWTVFLKSVNSVPLKLEVIKHMRLSGYGIDSFVIQSFILDASDYLDIAQLTDVIMEDFAELCNTALMNVVIHRLLRADEIDKAWKFVKYMAVTHELKPNLTTLNIFLEGMFRKGRLDWMFGVLSPMVTKFNIVPDGESYHHMLRAALKSSFHANISTVLQMIYGHAHSQGWHLSRASAMEMLKAQAWFQALGSAHRQLPAYYGIPRARTNCSSISTKTLPPDFPEPHKFYSQEPYKLNLSTVPGETEITLWQTCMHFLAWDNEAVLSIDSKKIQHFTERYILARALGIKPISSSEKAMSYAELRGRLRLKPLPSECVDSTGFLVSKQDRRRFKSLVTLKSHELLQTFLRQSNTLVREVYHRRIARKAKLGFDQASIIEAKAFGVFPHKKSINGLAKTG
ncbi:hypothetical protein V1525DRAFT_393818 [Lipomyces kononenkoae]|uniref:Uncharacterized protein n=1 Tax=Lipomyces kononenkoae TaxID=34357 RepID=A0ACC3TC71_LIPKO